MVSRQLFRYRLCSSSSSHVMHQSFWDFALRWRHNERDGFSNHQPHDCLLNRLFGSRSKKMSKLRVTGLCVGNSPGTGEFPAQIASNAEYVSIWWRHHGPEYCERISQYHGCWCPCIPKSSTSMTRLCWINCSMRKDFEYMCRLSFKKWQQTRIYFYVFWTKCSIQPISSSK